MTVEDLREIRSQLTPIIKKLEELTHDRPAYGAEVVKGLRDIQSGRMWIGVAEALMKGLNPWANQLPEKEGE